jgi:hypothetical protein
MRRWCVCFEVITPPDVGPANKDFFKRFAGIAENAQTKEVLP